MAETPVVVVTGPSGAGKGTHERVVLERMPELALAISATTRPRRASEKDGREYWFISDEEFDERIRDGEFLEWVNFVSDHRYGTPRSEIDRIRELGKVPVLDMEIEGACASVRPKARARSTSGSRWRASSRSTRASSTT